jgi:hypothetical protein
MAKIGGPGLVGNATELDEVPFYQNPDSLAAEENGNA